MAYSAYAGSFNIDSSVTAGNDQSVTGVGFQGKVVLFWWSGGTSAGDEVAGGTIRYGFGAAASSSSRWYTSCYSVDGAAASDTSATSNTDACIGIIASPASIDGEADFKQWDADGFTLTIDDQFTADYRISFLPRGRRPH